ncbi:MAG: hypothetical protein PVJ57_19790 [Phycisphaerae bacterium]|jgi:hypothetical protein
MPEMKVVYRVVLVSPGDVSEERDVARGVIEEINQLYKAKRIGLELYTWENDAQPGLARRDIQEEIVDPALNIRGADIVIGIFYRRVGRKGAIHEIKAAVKGWRDNGRPVVLVYFKDMGNTSLSYCQKSLMAS